MYKVIIAEDEMFVRLGIKTSVDWESLGLFMVADVENGQQALEAYEGLKPDIIITDIKMPVMDGITLIRKVREKDSRTRFLILSCLEEFGIVREAISLDVTDYVLKLTMTREDMEKVLDKAKKELRFLDMKGQQEGAEKNDKWTEDSLKNYLYYGLDLNPQTKRMMEEKFSKERDLLMVILELDQYQECKKIFNDSYGTILEPSVKNILSELLREEHYILLSEKEGRFILILQGEGEEDMSVYLEKLLNRIREVLKCYVKTSVSFGISRPGRGYSSLYEMYHQGFLALEKKFFYGLDRNILFKETYQQECRELIHRKLGKVMQHLKNNEKVIRKLKEAEEDFCQHENPDSIRFWFEHSISVWISQMLPEGNKRYEITGSFLDRVKNSSTLDEILGIYEECVRYWEEDPGNDKKLSKPVRDILQFISSHYGEDITLNDIANMVELSRTYVCGLFKKEMGVNLTAYIMEYRVEKAKELHRDTNLKSYEIAQKVGFLDESYFSRSFKKITGQSPNAYKKGIWKEL